ncbi:MAG: hypothetical protein AAFX99_10120 [Myxococcota bacterium]
MSAVACAVLLMVLMVIQVLFLSTAALLGWMLRIDFDQITLGVGPVAMSWRWTWGELRLGVGLPLGASVRYLGMMPLPETQPDPHATIPPRPPDDGDDPTDPDARQTPRQGWRTFRQAPLWQRWVVLLGPWAVIVAAGSVAMGSETWEVMPRVHRALFEAAWSPLEVGRPMVERWALRIDTGAWGSAVGRLAVAVAAVNLLPWPPMAMGLALLHIRSQPLPLTLTIVGVMVSAALGLGWAVAWIAALIGG